MNSDRQQGWASFIPGVPDQHTTALFTIHARILNPLWTTFIVNELADSGRLYLSATDPTTHVIFALTVKQYNRTDYQLFLLLAHHKYQEVQVHWICTR
ncbi:MAG: hypothetical protein WAV05_16890 [Anaerolineales bacterium]